MVCAEGEFDCRVVSIENSSPHWHHEYESFFVLRGGVTVHCEDSEWRLEAGNIFGASPISVGYFYPAE